MDRQEAILRSVWRFTGKVWGNISKTPKLPTKEKILIFVNIILTFIYIYIHNWPRITLILLLNYFVIKTMLQLSKERYYCNKYKGINDLFNNKVKIIRVKDNIVFLNSFIPLNLILAKTDHLEHFFSKKIESIVQNRNDFKHIKITLADNNKYKFKTLYPISEYIKTAKTKDFKIPCLFGISNKGKHIIIDIKKVVHMLISGEPGGGKSCLLNVIIQSLLYFNRNISMILVDFKRVELRPYKKLKNCYFINEHKPFLEMLQKLDKEMIRRMKLLEDLELTNVDQMKDKLPTIIVIIDEIADIKMSDDAELIEKIMRRIGNMGRFCEIFLIAATQRGSSVQLSTEIRAFLRSKVSFNIQDSQTQTMAGVRNTQDLKLGEFKTANMDMNGTVFKGYYVDRVKEWKVFKELELINRGGVILDKDI